MPVLALRVTRGAPDTPRRVVSMITTPLLAREP
jgi:hypothetical protein